MEENKIPDGVREEKNTKEIVDSKVENKVEEKSSDIKLQEKRKKIINAIKNFFTKEVEDKPDLIEETVGENKNILEVDKQRDKQANKQSDKQSQNSISEKEIDFDEKRKVVIEYVKKKPDTILYLLFALLIPLGYYFYKSKSTSLFLLDLFVPFPLDYYRYITFFLIIPIIAFTLIYYKKYVYIALLYLINMGFSIRIQNLHLLKDVTTGKYIPLALDPHVFLRYAKYILQNGSLYSIDPLRYFPFGADLSAETVLLSKFVVYLHKVLHFFNSNITIELTDVLYPPICFAISLVFFFLIVKNLFNKKIAIVSTFILAITPSYLYRTMAGFSDKESLGLMFLFMAFYFFIIGWKSNLVWKTIVFGLFSGLFTGLMGLTWGGVNFVLLLFAGFIIVEIFIKKFTKNDFYLYTSWIIVMTILMGFTTAKFGGLQGLVQSFTSGIAYLAFLIAFVDFILFKLDLFKIKKHFHNKVPLGIASTLISGLIGIIVSSIIISPSFFIDKFNSIFDDMVNPFGKTRWALTVAESHQPYFMSWVWDYNWYYLIFAFIGAIILFYYTLKPLSDEEGVSYYSIGYSIFYALFLMLFTMSRYEQGHITWNGISDTSKTAYIGSLISFIILIVVSYIYLFYFRKDLFNRIMLIDKKYVFIIIWFLISLVAARGALRLMLMLAPITALLVGYFIVYTVTKISKLVLEVKDEVYKWSLIVLLVIILIVAFWPFASIVNSLPVVKKVPFVNENGFLIDFTARTMGQSRITGPSYNLQWQLAGKWIRENTPEEAIFAHWWDYGYWVQTGGERTTVTDGGNWIGYWNHLMGRHGLMAQDQTEALEFFNMHNVTHFLVIYDEIGKIGAYSSIGADEKYDRRTWINTFVLNKELTQETREGDIIVYEGPVTAIDEDFEYNGVKYYERQAAFRYLYLPTKKVEVKVSENQTTTVNQILQPYIYLFKDGGQPEQVYIKCLYYQDQLLLFNQPGDKPSIDNCFMIIPSVSGGQFDPNGGGLYLGHDSFNSLWVNLFLLEQKNPEFSTGHFKLALSQQHPGVEDLSRQLGGSFVIDNVMLYNGALLGPLKIWEVDYPENLTRKPEYLLRNYKDAGLTEVTVI